MYCTGVPQSITLAREVRESQKTWSKWQDSIADIKESVPKKVVESLLERYTVEGVVPVTRADITQCMREVVEAEDGPFQRFFARIRIKLKIKNNVS